MKTRTDAEIMNFMSKFHCSRDDDLNDFLFNKSISYEKRDLARTYFYIEYEDDEVSILGYFTLALTSMYVSPDLVLSNSFKKRMNLKNDRTSGYLIGQLSKNDGNKEKIGKHLIELAMKKIESGHNIFGGRIICVDCKMTKSLVDWYESIGFEKICVVPETNLCRMVWIIR